MNAFALRRLFVRAPALGLCAALALAPPPAPGEDAVPAPPAERNETPPSAAVGVDRRLERDIALGRFQTRLEQDIQILDRVRKLLETLRQLAPYTGVVDTLFSGAPEEDRLLQALAALQTHLAARQAPPAAPAASVSAAATLPTAAPARPLARLNFVQPPRGGRPGKAILRIGEEYKMLYQGEELLLDGVPWRLQKIERNAVTLQPKNGGGAPYVVRWR